MSGHRAMVGDDVLGAGPLTLRPWQPADVAFVYDACQDAELQRWVPVPRPYLAGHAVQWLRRSEEGRRTNRAALFAIASTDTGELLGSIGLDPIDWDARRAECGLWVAAQARGAGVASIALPAVVVWAGDHLGLDEVWLQIAKGNAAARRTASRAGFVEVSELAVACGPGSLRYRRPTS